jgi:hypothetical protein
MWGRTSASGWAIPDGTFKWAAKWLEKLIFKLKKLSAPSSF